MVGCRFGGWGSSGSEKKKAKTAKPLLVSHKAFNSRVSNRLSYEAVTFLSSLNLIFRLKIFTQSF